MDDPPHNICDVKKVRQTYSRIHRKLKTDRYFFFLVKSKFILTSIKKKSDYFVNIKKEDKPLHSKHDTKRRSIYTSA